MGSRSDLLRLHRDAILDLLATRGVEDVRVFGSIARGEDESASDIDLIVELHGERSSGAELRGFCSSRRLRRLCELDTHEPDQGSRFTFTIPLAQPDPL